MTEIRRIEGLQRIGYTLDRIAGALERIAKDVDGEDAALPSWSGWANAFADQRTPHERRTTTNLVDWGDPPFPKLPK